METYQVCVCTTSMPARALIWVRFSDNASRAPLNFLFRALGDLAPGFLAAHVQIALVALLLSPAMHFDGDFARQFAAEVLHMNAGTTIDVRGIFPGKESYAQGFLRRRLALVPSKRLCAAVNRHIIPARHQDRIAAGTGRRQTRAKAQCGMS